MERDAGKRLTGRVEIDDASLGGGRSGGKRRRGAPGKTPIIVAMETNARGPAGAPEAAPGRRLPAQGGGKAGPAQPRSPQHRRQRWPRLLPRYHRCGMHASADPHRLRPHGGAATRLQVGQHRARQHRDRHLPGHPPATHPPLPGRIRLPLRSTLRSRRHDAASRLGRRPHPANALPPPQMAEAHAPDWTRALQKARRVSSSAMATLTSSFVAACSAGNTAFAAAFAASSGTPAALNRLGDHGDGLIAIAQVRSPAFRTRCNLPKTEPSDRRLERVTAPAATCRSIARFSCRSGRNLERRKSD